MKCFPTDMVVVLSEAVDGEGELTFFGAVEGEV